MAHALTRDAASLFPTSMPAVAAPGSRLQPADMTFLSTISLFAGLSAEELALVASHLHERRYRKSALVYDQGEPGDAVFIVRQGRVKEFRIGPDGREQIVEMWAAGDLFGLVAALDGKTYPSTAESVDDTRTWMMRTADLMRLVATLPQLCTNLLRLTGDRLRTAQDRLHALSVQRVHQRVAAFLLKQVMEHGQPIPGGARVELGLTHQELGGLLGASRERITRVLSDFRRTGALGPGEGEGSMFINLERLAEWAHE